MLNENQGNLIYLIVWVLLFLLNYAIFSRLKNTTHTNILILSIIFPDILINHIY